MKKTVVYKNEQSFGKMNNISSAMALFFRYPRREFTLTEVAKETALSKGAMSHIISELAKAGFVTISAIGKAYRIRADVEGSLYKKEKAAYNIAGIIRSGLPEFLASRHHHPRCIVLFGSFRRGEDDEDSDIDIAVEVPAGEETGSIEHKELRSFGRQMGRKISIHLYDRKTIDRNVFLSIANGIVLYGLLEI